MENCQVNTITEQTFSGRNRGDQQPSRQAQGSLPAPARFNKDMVWLPIPNHFDPAAAIYSISRSRPTPHQLAGLATALPLRY